ncbi:MAG: hypothetical protein ACK5Q3_05470, partial [Planctomycetota bacterium]
MKRNQSQLLKFAFGGALACGLALLPGTVFSVCLAQDATATGKPVSPQTLAAIQAIKAMPGISVQEKDGEVIGVDFRKCGDDWVKTFPRV